MLWLRQPNSAEARSQPGGGLTRLDSHRLCHDRPCHRVNRTGAVLAVARPGPADRLGRKRLARSAAKPAAHAVSTEAAVRASLRSRAGGRQRWSRRCTGPGDPLPGFHSLPGCLSPSRCTRTTRRRLLSLRPPKSGEPRDIRAASLRISARLHSRHRSNRCVRQRTICWQSLHPTGDPTARPAFRRRDRSQPRDRWLFPLQPHGPRVSRIRSVRLLIAGVAGGLASSSSASRVSLRDLPSSPCPQSASLP